MSIRHLYNTFIERNLISDTKSLIQILVGFPYYFKIIEYNNTILVKSTIKTDKYVFDDEYDNYKELLRNLIINKLNYLDFYYFGKNMKEIKTNELFEKINQDIDLEKHIFYKYNHNIKYFIYFINDKWCISCEGKLDIYSLNNMSLFEKYTLYELLLQSFSINKITLNNFDKKYNYVLTLNSSSTYLTIYENSNVHLVIHSIIDKKTNIPLKLNREILDRLNLRISIPVRLYFDNMFHFKKDINLSFNQRLIVKNIETNEERIYNYPKFRRFYILLENFNTDPIKNIFQLIENGQLDLFLNHFPLYKFFITNLIRTTKIKEDYLFKKYLDVYIKKTNVIDYQPYDKELLLKIHAIYQQFRRNITKLDVHNVLFQLKTEKIQKIILINYNLNPFDVEPIIDCSLSN